MDEAGYRDKEKRQTRPGIYHVNAGSLLPTTRTIMPHDTRIRSQVTGSITTRSLPVNTESDLRGIGRPVSRAPASFTQGPSYSSDSDVVRSGHHSIGGKTGEGVSQIRTQDVQELRTMDSRLDMPALALRGATPNRFHPHLLHDPTDFVFAPFDRLVSSRIVMKDQWRVPQSSLTSVRPPTIPAHIEQKPAY
jgi:hypothetical protein